MLQNSIISQALDDLEEDDRRHELITSISKLVKNPDMVQEWQIGKRIF